MAKEIKECLRVKNSEKLNLKVIRSFMSCELVL